MTSTRLHQIYNAAAACFREKGIQATSMDDIARVARIARPNLYRYIEDRTDLIRMVAVQRTIELTNGLNGGAGPWEDQLTQLFVALIERGRNDQLLRIMVEEAGPTASRLMMDPELGLSTCLNPMLQPILTEARQTGRLRPNLDDTETMWWIHFQTWTFTREPDLAGGLDIALFVRKYVVGALTTADDPGLRSKTAAAPKARIGRNGRRQPARISRPA